MGKAIPIVLFGDSHAMEIGPLFENGIYLLKVNISLEGKPSIDIDRSVVIQRLEVEFMVT